MAIVNAESGMLLLTADLLRSEGRVGFPSNRSYVRSSGLLALRFPPIEDLVTALDRIASREIAA